MRLGGAQGTRPGPFLVLPQSSLYRYCARVDNDIRDMVPTLDAREPTSSCFAHGGEVWEVWRKVGGVLSWHC